MITLAVLVALLALVWLVIFGIDNTVVVLAGVVVLLVGTFAFVPLLSYLSRISGGI
jgi:hypothetical protein